ncbi:hypothetical protein BC939DRAFT_446654 [Gamsiella multidivaricata]|uniref:uncharacterized protein n=1 Tax=Gamsiella multidivaricata TaxID=101098 RepID=UPI00221F1563|nr:uncharacterized protein BC939DRAFT_446654 [Gamsiella multidivaricata]KAG0370522.1 hypothetical protein BGZ54_005905 [Gamsiella multidivaricata]KAI7826524.1 hypothetical protein BC939DRAFT_446654 [Gamsiella multidivaricata]
MATFLLSSLLSQLSSNQAQDAAATSVPLSVSTSDWTWKWVSETEFFALLTSKSTNPLFPPPKTIPNGLFLLVFSFCLISLYALLISPYPRTRGKQILALPLLTTMVLLPLFFTTPLQIVHMAMSVTAIAVATRMFDLYYVQPWTGVRSRYCLDEVARSKKDLDSNQHSIIQQQREFETFLIWDKQRFKVEMWAPLRRFSTKQKSAPASRFLRWQDLLLQSLLYNIVLDIDIFIMSHYTSEELEVMPIPEYVFCMIAIVTFIMSHILWICATFALIYSLATRRPVDLAEWGMLANKLPCFALTPAELWIHWQTLFRYLWVDLGFLPVKRFCKQHLGPECVGTVVSKAAQEVLPVLAVFTLSGILHAYTVYAAWRESVWSQLFYFILQGVAVVATKAVERTWFGRKIRYIYNNGSSTARWGLHGLGLLMMAVFHTFTLPFFMEPYKRHSMWLPLNERSVLWWIYGKAA